ncbi:hypothetical protein [Capnocytophaga stomatis]|uniref:Uncharacterized protein n=1 Tax=Capnocytophaga stomatis TaxID=1848904 RepID=A0ABW8Q8H9_9FLAO|nr:hypothetical protein [Capnocytophaga stomatis]GIJ96088.1 hypothetical protein CAPN001_06570 [Capnocytophaga stomatis]GIM50361.1 hypothetical protein CAPN003_18130 [Capnocytophaga stomatis]
MTRKYTIKDIDLKLEILMALPIIPVGCVGFAAFLCRGLSDFHHKKQTTAP